jgi:hypothetical protein
MSKYDQWISSMISYSKPISVNNANEGDVTRILYDTKSDPADEQIYNLMNEKACRIIVPQNKSGTVKEVLNQANLNRKEFERKRLIQQVREYDNRNNNPNSRWVDYMEYEVAPEDQNEMLDNKLDNIFVKNLEIGDTELKKIGIDASDELDEFGQHILKKQNETASLRQVEFDNIKSKLVKSIQNYDDKKKKDDSKYECLDFSQKVSAHISIQEEFSNLRDKIDMASLRNNQHISVSGFNGLSNLDFY